jgi:hypothetical protein
MVPRKAPAAGAVLAVMLAAAAQQLTGATNNCSIRLLRAVSGSCGTPSECPGTWAHKGGGCPWGCAADPKTMFTIRGCCADFECGGSAVRCCSHQHLHPQLCRCGPPPPPPRAGGIFVVDGAAAPGGDGSSARPFSTIGSCIAVAAPANASSTCRVRAGVYREELLLPSPLGVSIVGDGVGSTVVDGTRPLVGLRWTRHSGSVYRAAIPAGPLRFPYRQLFAGGTYIPEARWPNARLDTMLSRSAWATMRAGSGWGIVRGPPVLSNGSATDWDGARVTLNLGTGVFTWVRTVRNFSLDDDHGGGGGSTFRYDTALNALKRAPGCVDGAPCKSFVGSRYFLQGVLAALDSVRRDCIFAHSPAQFLLVADLCQLD